MIILKSKEFQEQLEIELAKLKLEKANLENNINADTTF